MHFNELPAEIRLSIFRLATLKISQDEDTYVNYHPFEAVALHDRDWSSSAQRALDVKMTIVLVCKEWKKIATEMLYECIRIQHGTEALLTALEGHADTPFDNGRWARRVEISERVQDFDPFNPRMVLRVLERCPLVETIVRPCLTETGGAALGTVRFDSGQTFPSFPSVKRIDWWLPGAIPGPRAISDSRPEFLVELIAHAPNLQYLTLSGKTWRSPWQGADKLNKLFVYPPYNSITTLRMEGEIENMLTLADASLPNLHRLVLGGLYAPVQPILQKHGPLIQSLELLDLVVPLNSFSRLSTFGLGTEHLFKACPNLKELCVPLSLGTTLLNEGANCQIILESLTCIRIKVDSSSPLTSPDFGYFMRDKLSCPSLERIVLYGKPQMWRENACYKVLEKIVSQRNLAALEFA